MAPQSRGGMGGGVPCAPGRGPASTVKVILISLKAGGEGLNLQVASNVFLLDPWWNPPTPPPARPPLRGGGGTSAQSPHLTSVLICGMGGGWRW